MIPIQIIQHRHVKRRGDRPLLLVSAHVQIHVIRPSIRQSMNQPRIAVIRKNHRLVLREQHIKIRVAQSMRMLALRLQFHQVHHVHHPHFQLRQSLSQNRNRRQRLQRRHIASARHHHIRLGPAIAARPIPDAQPGRAMLHRRIHVQPLRRGVFPGHHHVHIMPAPQTMIHHRQQTIRIRRQINPHNLGLLVHHQIDKPRILMRKSVVILPPHVR